MAEYIGRDELLKRMEERLNNLRKENGNYDAYTDGFEEGCVAVEDAETVDVAPVVHGKWIKITTTGTDMFGEPTEVVIACNCSVYGLDGREETDFCPHCGAIMKGVN